MKDNFRIEYDKYVKYFSESWLWRKLKMQTKSIGIGVSYPALLLFYTFKRKETPAWAKRTITGALGYFLLPFDIIPDPLLPIIGFTDDIMVLSAAMMVVTAYIDADVVENARNKLTEWFGAYDVKQLEEIENAAKKKDEGSEEPKEE